MKTEGLSARAVGLTFAGCFLGVGCMSGQEVWQFFGRFGVPGCIGMLAAVTGLALFNLLIIRLVSKSADARIDHIAVSSGNRVLCALVGALEVLVFFGTYVVTASGAGALFESLVGIPGAHYIGAGLFCVILSFIAVKGIRGVVGLFSYAVPPLVLLAFLVSVITLIRTGDSFSFTLPPVERHPLIPNAPLGALTFMSYNLFCSIGVLCPVGLQVKNRKAAIGGTIFGSVLLLVEMTSVIFALVAMPQAASSELPMLAVAGRLSPALGSVYAFLLFFSMAGASLACLVPTVTYLAEHIPCAERHGAMTIFAVSAAAFVLSCFGFADLVATVFSFLGYLALVPLFGILRKGWKSRRDN